MKAKIPSWLAQLVSLVLMLAGLGILADGLMYEIIVGPLDLVLLAADALVFLAGLFIFFWDRRRRRLTMQTTPAALRVLYFQMTRAFLVLLLGVVIIYVVWSTELQRTVWYWWLSICAGAGFLGSLFSIWAYYREGGDLGWWEFLAALVLRSRP